MAGKGLRVFATRNDAIGTFRTLRDDPPESVMRAKADIYQVRHRRVAEQQPWALLDNCEAQNLEKPRNGTREEGDPLALVSKSPHASTLREIARDPVSFAQG
jgi:hypothetical protein